MRNLAIIPARGGSKRIPGKNIRPFLGKPIIAYPIEAAAESGLFAEIMVSTDSEQIAAVARQYGAAVPFLRSSENAGDCATLAEVLLEVLDQYRRTRQPPEAICCLLPTAPLVRSSRLKEAYRLLVEGRHDAVCPVVRFSYPIWRSLRVDAEGTIRMIWPEYLKSRSQDLPTAYHDSGSFYWITAPSLEAQKTLFTADCVALELPETEVQDIDNVEDWELAELKYRVGNAQHEKGEGLSF